MRLIVTTLLLLAASAATATALPVEALAVPHNNSGWLVPQADGSLQWLSVADVAVFYAQEATTSERASTVVDFHLYTKRNPTVPQQINVNDAAALAASHFDGAQPTRFIIHGWQNDHRSSVNVVLRQALLAGGADYNVFCVDWSSRAATINYPAAVLHVPDVGQRVAAFIDFLHQSGGLRYNALLLMGHSLGAHVAGFAGKQVRHGRIQQITGLDPAYPLYQHERPAERLNQNDALYVESIQTNAGLLGFLEPVGKGAFYPNGGASQPGCGVDVSGSCAHSRSYEYYAEALSRNNFPSVKCASYENAMENACGSTYSSVKMGAATNVLSAAGDFYVPVNRKSPYGMGK